MSDAANIGLSGLVNFQTTDDGFFGTGLYVTLQAHYAARYSRGGMGKEGIRQPNANGEFALLFMAASCSNALMVSRQSWYDPGARTSKLFGKTIPKKPIFFDTVVAPVDEAQGWQVTPAPYKADAIEVVLRDPAQALPLAVVYFK